MLWVVAGTVFLTASTPTLPNDALPRAAATSEYPSEEALRRYAQGRLLEEGGESSDALSEFYRALLLDPHAPSVARRVSELSGRQGEYQRSLEFADRALTFDPNDARSLWLKGLALFNLGRMSESLDVLLAATQADSEDVEYQRTLARVAEHVDRIDLVARAYARAVELEDDDGESWFQLAAAEARLADFAAAEKALDRAVELNPFRPGVFFLQGWVQEGLGRNRRAAELYRRHLTIHANDQVTRRRLVNLLMREKQFAEAYQQAKVWARARPQDSEAKEVETDLAFELKHTEEARRLIAEMEREAHGEPDQLTPIIALLARHGRGREAIGMADKWELQHPHDSRGVILAARARAMAGQPEAAIERARRAVEASPDSIAPRILLGRLYQSDKKYREAEVVWTETARRFPARPGVSLDLAYCREQLGDLDGAQQAARDALNIDPDSPTVLNFLGYLMADHNRNLEEAADLIRRAVNKEPDNGAFIDSMGWVYYRMGRLEDARRQLERAVHLLGTDPVVHEHLGDVYKDLQLLELARDQYRKSLAADGSNGRVKAKLASTR